MDITDFPLRARRVLIDTLRRPVGTKLPCSWYEFPRTSNFDTWPREQLRDATEAAGFIRYEGGHPWTTQAGNEWALAQPTV